MLRNSISSGARLGTIAALVGCLVITATANANPTYRNTVLADNPLAYWRLGDAGGGAADETGNGHNGAVDGAGVVFGVPGLLPNSGGNSAINVTGIDRAAGRIVVPGFEKFPVGSTGNTVEFWVKVNNNPNTWQNVVGDGESGGDFFMMTYLHGVASASNGQVRPHFNGTGTISVDSGVPPITPGNTYHVVSTWDGSQSVMYISDINDALITQASSAGTAVSGNPTNTDNPMYIGRDNREPGGDMIIDEAAYYNYALTTNQVIAHFNAAKIPEPSSAALLAIGLTGLVASAWRRRRR